MHIIKICRQNLLIFSLGEDSRTKMRAHVSGLDHAIGQIINGLKMRGFWENTILIFSNDNGGLYNNDYLANYPLKGRKGLGLDYYLFLS